MSKFKINDIVTWESKIEWNKRVLKNRGIIVKLGETRMGGSKIKPTAKIHLLSVEYPALLGREFTTVSQDRLTRTAEAQSHE